MLNESDRIDAAVQECLWSLSARAAGWWRLEVNDGKDPRLVLLAFATCPDLPDEVEASFKAATAEVPLSHTDLGIVRAILDRSPAISILDHLPVDRGSGLWLRAFGARRSVAVPLVHPAGELEGVLSVALPTTDPPNDSEVAERVRMLAEPALPVARRNSSP